MKNFLIFLLGCVGLLIMYGMLANIAEEDAAVRSGERQLTQWDYEQAQGTAFAVFLVGIPSLIIVISGIVGFFSLFKPKKK